GGGLCGASKGRNAGVPDRGTAAVNAALSAIPGDGRALYGLLEDRAEKPGVLATMHSRLISTLTATTAIAAALFAQNKPAADVPFKSAFRGIAFVSGSLNHGSPLNMLLDTGAGGSSVNRRKAEALGLKMAAGRVSVSADPSLEAGVIQQATIAVA